MKVELFYVTSSEFENKRLSKTKGCTKEQTQWRNIFFIRFNGSFLLRQNFHFKY